MNSRRTFLAGLRLVIFVICLGVVSVPAVFAAPAPSQDSGNVESIKTTEPTFPDGGDEERSADGQYREDIVPLESAEERGKFLTTLLMLEDLQEGRPGAKFGHPERLQSDEEVMTEVFKFYQNQAFQGKHYLKIPPKLMKKVHKKLKQLMNE